MFVLRLLLVGLLALNAMASDIISRSNIVQNVPPPAIYGVNHEAFGRAKGLLKPKSPKSNSEEQHDDNELDDDDHGFIWEKSGYFEGDIVLYNDDTKNAAVNKATRWPNATIPFFIEEKDFDDKEVETILEALKEFHAKTCLRFRPYQPSDENWVIVTGSASGCWSTIGMKGEGGQQLNVNSPKCVKKGTVIHEFLHAAGFYHQQSASNRDDYVRIVWENIMKGHESNFNKYNESVVTDYGVSYDYGSIMHYSGKAFSINGNDTIVAIQNTTVLGQRQGFSEKDIKKLNEMYDSSCHPQQPKDKQTFATILDWFGTLFV